MNTYKFTFCGNDSIQVDENESKARYKAYLSFSDIYIGFSFGDFIRLVKCKRIGSFKAQDFFGDIDSFNDVKQRRDIDFAYQGMRVEINGQKGTIVGGNRCLNLDVVFDGEYYKTNCHPWWKIKYFDKKGNAIKEYNE